MRAENPQKCPHPHSYPGHSERTQSRQKLAQRKLAAQGFATLPEFLKRVEEKKQQQARLSALVAAATTATRSKQGGQYNLEEEEELPVVEKDSSKNVTALHTHKHMLETSPTSNMEQGHGLGNVITTCVVGITPRPKPLPELIQIDDSNEDRDESEPSDTAYGSASRESAHVLRSQIQSDPELCQKASPKPFEESEESSTSSESQSDEDEPIEDDPPSKKIRLDLEDIHGIVAHKLEELRCRNDPDSVVPKVVQKDALGYLQDRTGLLAAREKLVALMAKNRT